MGLEVVPGKGAPFDPNVRPLHANSLAHAYPYLRRPSRQCRPPSADMYLLSSMHGGRSSTAQTMMHFAGARRDHAGAQRRGPGRHGAAGVPEGLQDGQHAAAACHGAGQQSLGRPLVDFHAVQALCCDLQSASAQRMLATHPRILWTARTVSHKRVAADEALNKAGCTAGVLPGRRQRSSRGRRGRSWRLGRGRGDHAGSDRRGGGEQSLKR